MIIFKNATESGDIRGTENRVYGKREIRVCVFLKKWVHR